jgi:hypothetical protein
MGGYDNPISDDVVIHERGIGLLPVEIGTHEGDEIIRGVTFFATIDMSVFVEEAGGYWDESKYDSDEPEGRAPCPAHPDEDMCLEMWTDAAGIVEISCTHGCSGQAIYTAFRKKGIVIDDMYFPESEKPSGRRGFFAKT